MWAPAPPFLALESEVAVASYTSTFASKFRVTTSMQWHSRGTYVRLIIPNAGRIATEIRPSDPHII